jgi:hypothetical protein
MRFRLFSKIKLKSQFPPSLNFEGLPTRTTLADQWTNVFIACCPRQDSYFPHGGRRFRGGARAGFPFFPETMAR